MRGRWFKKVGKITRRGQRKLVRDGSLEESLVLDGQHGNRLPRDIDLFDDDDDEDEDSEEGETARALWVPYVHFGV
ncbi:Tetratricopeptide-like helical [Penicillium expansum]|nr:Tetratricopeptide-like helical [Penicillium expansum]